MTDREAIAVRRVRALLQQRREFLAEQLRHKPFDDFQAGLTAALTAFCHELALALPTETEQPLEERP